MSSQIDPTVIKDDQPVDKRDLRNQFEIAQEEISALQTSTTLVRRMMVDDNLWNSL
jgi:hypothetical protein